MDFDGLDVPLGRRVVDRGHGGSRAFHHRSGYRVVPLRDLEHNEWNDE